MVIVILGVLSAVAIPKFVDLKADAQDAATKGVAGAISSASAINYAAKSVNPSKGVTVGDCVDGGLLLLGGILPAGYSLGTGFPPTPISPGVTANCKLTGPNATTAFAAITGTP